MEEKLWEEIIEIFTKHQISGISCDLKQLIDQEFILKTNAYAKKNAASEYCKYIYSYRRKINDYVWYFSETVPYEYRTSLLPFDKNLPLKMQDDIINLYRQSSYDFGLRIVKTDNGYFIYWDKIQLNNTDFDRLRFSMWDLYQKNTLNGIMNSNYKETQEKVNVDLRRILK